MNRQAVFDTITQHLLTQKCRSKNDEESPMCLYRGKGTFEGTKCAIGCLISDEYYSKELEGKPICDPRVRTAVEKSLNTEISACTRFDDYSPDEFFLRYLQYIHDKRGIAEWYVCLQNTATRYYLKFNPPAI
jgi:hypothetical protein